MSVPLTAQTIPALGDGYVGKVIDRYIETIYADIADRPHEPKARTLVIKLTFTPDGKQVEIAADTKTTVPSMKPPVTIAKTNAWAGGFLFSPDCSDNPDQQPIPGTTDE